MAIEIERKFLVGDDSWRPGAVGTDYRQGYLAALPHCSVRVRVSDDRAWLTRCRAKTPKVYWNCPNPW